MCQVLGLPEGRSSLKWQDYSLDGHQIVCHLVASDYRCQDFYNPVGKISHRAKYRETRWEIAASTIGDGLKIGDHVFMSCFHELKEHPRSR